MRDGAIRAMTRKKDGMFETSSSVKESKYLQNKAKFEVYGEEMIEKEVKQSGNSGRIYLPPDWVGKHVKIIRID